MSLVPFLVAKESGDRDGEGERIKRNTITTSMHGQRNKKRQSNNKINKKKTTRNCPPKKRERQLKIYSAQVLFRKMTMKMKSKDKIKAIMNTVKIRAKSIHTSKIFNKHSSRESSTNISMY